MKSKQIVGLVVVVILFIVTGTASVMTHSASDKIFERATEKILSGDMNFAPPAGEYIAVVDIVGTIQQQGEDVFSSEKSYKHSTTLQYIDELMNDSHNRAILLYVDSPGGTVYESQEMYDKLIEYKEETGRPIYAYMEHYGASGAYMISMAADEIYANQNTITGSIGVIMSGYDLSGLYKKLGIKEISVTSGKNKAATFTDEQMEIYKEQVDEYFDAFVSIVEKGRGMSEKKVRKLADGRTYTARQAKKNGLIDRIASFDDAKEQIGMTVGTHQYYALEADFNFLYTIFSKAAHIIPKSDTQVLSETAEELESGVFMYYADL